MAMQQTLFDLKEDALGRMLVDWKKKKIRRAEGAGVLYAKRIIHFQFALRLAICSPPLGKE